MQQATVRKMGAVLRSDNFVVCAKIVVRAIVRQKSSGKVSNKHA
jgi:hypothetical protein